MAKTSSKSKRRASPGSATSTQSSKKSTRLTEGTHAGYGTIEKRQAPALQAGPSSSSSAGPNVHFSHSQSHSYEYDTYSSDDDWDDHHHYSAPAPIDQRSKISPENIRTPPNGYLVQNVSSVARDHMALERTFLSYVRSTLGIAAAGVGLVQLLTVKGLYLPPDKDSAEHQRWNKVDKYARPLGAVIVAFSLLVLLMGTSRYFRIQSSLLKGFFPIGRYTITIIAAGIAFLIIVVFTIIALLSRVVYSS